MHEPSTQPALRSTWIAAGALVVAGAVLLVFRYHAFELPLETDECNYAYIAARLLDGKRLYVDVWDHQPPGVFVMLAGLIAVFGDSPAVFRWTATVFSLASMVLIYGIVRRTAGLWPAIVAALLFALVSADPGTGGEGANREVYMNALVLAAWYCGLRWALSGLSKITRPEAAGGLPTAVDGGRVWLVAAGAALALGSTIKTVLAVQWVGLAVCVMLIAVMKTPAKRRLTGAGAAVFLLGAVPALVWLLTLAYFAATGRHDEFIEAVFRFNVGYSDGGESFVHRFGLFFRPPRHPFIFASAWPVWIAALVALVALIAAAMINLVLPGAAGSARRDPAAILAAGLAISSYLAVCLPGRFWPHYYHLLVPAAVITIAIGAGYMGAAVQLVTGSSRAARSIIAAVLLGTTVMAGIWEYRHYLSQPLFGITVHRYNSRDFWGRAQGDNVARATEPGDKVFVFGNEAEIYYYSGRRCASRYTMITGLADGLPGAEQRREILLQELEADPPRLILVLFDVQPWPAWREFLVRYYSEPVGWDYHDRTGQPIMFVLARKDRPIPAIDWNWDRGAVGGWHLADDQPR